MTSMPSPSRPMTITCVHCQRTIDGDLARTHWTWTGDASDVVARDRGHDVDVIVYLCSDDCWHEVAAPNVTGLVFDQAPGRRSQRALNGHADVVHFRGAPYYPAAMSQDEFTVVLEADAPRPLPFGPGWPEFIGGDPVADRLMPVVREEFADFSLVLLAPTGEVAAGGWGVPLQWDGTVENLPEGWDGALEQSVANREQSLAPDTFCAMATEVMAAWQGRHLSARVLSALRDHAYSRGLKRMIAPTRPTLKAKYPLTPIERYAYWTRDDGAPFDPWVRIHHGLGARVIAPAPTSMVIRSSVSQWEGWSRMQFPESGRYVVPDALDPLTVDRESGTATYVEPAVWVRHPDA